MIRSGSWQSFVKQETLEVHGYKKLDEVIRQLEKRLPAHVRSTLGYSVDALVDRLAQKITMIMTVPFLREAVARHVNGSMSFPSDDTDFIAGGIEVDTATGNVRPQLHLLSRNLGAFLFLWLAFLAAWAASLWTGRRNPSALLLFGVAAADLTFKGNDARFMDYCRRGPLEPLRTAKKLVVHTPQRIVATRPAEATYTRLPLLHLFSTQRMRISSSLFFLAMHTRALVAFLWAVIRAPIHSVLWRDFAEHAAAAALNRAGSIEAVVITNTNWLQQLLWMNALEQRRFKCHMALYSLNSHAIVYRSDPVDHAYPGIRQLKVDEVWVWNEPYRARLAADGVTVQSVVVEPILWYLPETPRIETPADGITLCVFDVQPKTTEASRANGSLVNYYNTDTAIRFIDDILRARDRVAWQTAVDIRIVLKHKRPATWQHDPRYFEHIETLRTTASGFEVAPSDSNVYALISDSDLVIAPPYSSPAYVAAHVGVPAIFYDATAEVLPTHAPHPLIRFMDGYSALELAMARLEGVADPSATRR